MLVVLVLYKQIIMKKKKEISKREESGLLGSYHN